MELTITPMPGNYGRPFFRSANTGQQRHYRGELIDLSDAEAAEAQLRRLVRLKRVTHMEILQGQDKTHILNTVELAPPVPHALAAPVESDSPAMLTPLHNSPRPAARQQQQQDMPFDGMTMFLYNQQEQRLAELRERNEELRDQVKAANETNRTLEKELSEKKLELQLLDREHQQDLRDARAEMAANAAPGGIAGALAGLPPEASGAVVNSVLGFLGQFMGGGAGAAAGAPNALALPAGTSPRMHQVAVAATEIFPDEDTAGRVMVALSRIVPHPEKLNQLLILGEMPTAQPSPQPHNAS